MRKIVGLTESDLTRIVKKTINENINQSSEDFRSICRKVTASLDGCSSTRMTVLKSFAGDAGALDKQRTPPQRATATTAPGSRRGCNLLARAAAMCKRQA